jgi:hypothetical protein
MHFLLSDKYVCAKLKLKLWFYFDGHLWRSTELGPYKEISTVILETVKTYKKGIEERLLIPTETQHESFHLKALLEKTDKLISILKTVKDKEGICKECLYLFYDPDFFSKLDKKKHLICFENGVFDLMTKELRTPRRDDFISLFVEEPYDVEDEHIYEKIARFSTFRDMVISKRKPKNIYFDEE